MQILWIPRSTLVFAALLRHQGGRRSIAEGASPNNDR